MIMPNSNKRFLACGCAMRSHLIPVTVSIVLAALNTTAMAQDSTQPATYGSIALSSGFSPDPHVVDITVGGDNNAADTDSSCVGYVASSPDYSLEYTYEQYALGIFAISATDTTLLINDPEGVWFCNDDSGDLDSANPGIYFSSPKTGRYDIWVGSYSTETNYGSAKIVISEQDTANWRTIATSLAGTSAPIDDPVNSVPVTPIEPPVVIPTEGVIQYGRKSL